MSIKINYLFFFKSSEELNCLVGEGSFDSSSIFLWHAWHFHTWFFQGFQPWFNEVYCVPYKIHILCWCLLRQTPTTSITSWRIMFFFVLEMFIYFTLYLKPILSWCCNHVLKFYTIQSCTYCNSIMGGGQTITDMFCHIKIWLVFMI